MAISEEWRQSLRGNIEAADSNREQRRKSAQISDTVTAHYIEQLNGQLADVRSSPPCLSTMDPPKPPFHPQLCPENSHHASAMPAIPEMSPSPFKPSCQLPSPPASTADLPTSPLPTQSPVSTTAFPLADTPVNEHFSTDLNPFSQTRPACEIIQSSDEDKDRGEM